MAREPKLIEVQTVKFQLGDQIFAVRAAGLNKSEVWRAKFQEQVAAVLEMIKEQRAVLGDLDLDNLDLANVDIFEWLPVVIQVFTQLNISMNRLGELIASYHIDLDKDYIFDNATTAQAIVALWEIVQLEYPFGLLREMFQSSRPDQNGQPEAMTSQNSSGPSMASGLESLRGLTNSQ